MVVPEDCSVENNTVTIAWQTHPTSWVEGYVLELDDGCNGEYRVRNGKGYAQLHLDL